MDAILGCRAANAGRKGVINAAIALLKMMMASLGKVRV